jgi:hypothetical protein
MIAPRVASVILTVLGALTLPDFSENLGVAAGA